MDNRTIDGYTFKYDDGYFECRGDAVLDDEGDEAPEPDLWMAALKLEHELINEGHDAEAEHSEKGWVEVRLGA